MNARLGELSEAARDERVRLVSISLLAMLILFLFLAANQVGLSQAAPNGPQISAVEQPFDSLEGGECVDFEDLQAGTQYGIGQMFTSGGAEINVIDFQPPVGMSISGGFAQVENNSPSLSGGTGNEMAVNNVNLSFNFGKPIMGLTLLFGEYGGSISLEVNGDVQYVDNFADMPNLIGGVQVEVFGGVDNQPMGSLNLTGRIDSFAIGGQELWIDDICPKLPDVGDAPDSETNHTGDFMSAYSGPIDARYPTVFEPSTGLPPGPAHWFPRQDAWLGQWVTRELDADLSPDEDPASNLDPSADAANRDEADDGVIFPNQYPHCEPVEMQVLVTIVGDPNKRFVNVWFDWNHDGDWQDSFNCPTGQPTSEWAVRDFLITEPNTGTHLITLPTFLPYNTDPVDDGMWARVTLSELPAQIDDTDYADGRGPDFGFRFGETQDYYIPDAGEPTPTATPTEPSDFTPTPFPDFTPTPFPDFTPTPFPDFTPTPTPTPPSDFTPTPTSTQPSNATPTSTQPSNATVTPTEPSNATPTATIRPTEPATPSPSPTRTAIPTIVVTKVAHISEVKIGEEIDYSIIVKNQGQSDATGIVVEDAIPAHTSYVASSASSGAVSYDGALNQIRWHGDIAASEMVTIGLTVEVHGGANGELPSLRNTLAALATIDFETPALGGSARQVINPYTDGSTGVVFETTSATWGDEVVGLVKNNSTSACVHPSDEDQKLGTGRANGATGGNIGLSGFPIKGTFPGELAPPVTVSVEFQTLAGQPIRLRLFDSAGNEVAATTDVAAPANGTCGYPGNDRARTTISATSTEPVAYAMMDMGTVTGSYVFVIDNFEFESDTQDVCKPIITNRVRVVLPTGEVIVSDEVSTDVLCADMGDAPDSESNHFGAAMSAYGAVLGYYPTVYDPGTGIPEGPAHWKPEADAWLGHHVTLEVDADLMPDEDSHPNLVPLGDISNWDEADDGLITDTLDLNHCQDSKFEVEVNIVGGVNKRYLNVWFDWNRDGDWQDRFECENGEVITEWAVQDQVIGLGNGTHTVPTNIFKAYNPKRAVWMRITLSEQVAPRNSSTGLADGRGPVGGYRYGETEDYLYRPASGSIHGQKWHDLNGNGVKDNNEPPLADWRILLKDENGQVQATATDKEGNYWFMDLPSGVYSATEFIPSWSDWMQTFPTTGSHTIDLDPGEVVEEVDFGNWQGSQKNDFCILPWDNHFLTPDTLDTQVYIFNDSNTPNKAYRVQLVGLPAGSWGAADGPTQFDILDPMPILLNPGEYGTVDVRVYYPDSFAAGNPGPAYFAAIVTNLSSGTTFTCQAALWPVLPWWTGPVNLGIGGIPPGFSKGVAFRVMNNNDDQNRTLSETITYTVRAMTPGIEDSDDGSSSIVSLNGQPAGETISGQVTLEAGAETTVNIGVEFMEEGGLGPTDILFEMDIDGDGNPDAITTGIVQAVDAERATQIFLPIISR